jgi:hypothetical protein
MAIFDQARPEVYQMAREILEAHHPELRMPDGLEFASIAILMASAKPKENGEPTGEPPLKDGGYPVLGRVKAVPYEQRVDGRRDAVIHLDASAWDEMTEPQQRALLDHFISHLEIKTKDGLVVCDDWGRPKLELVLCDWRLQGFRSIAQRYGADAPEVAAARVFAERHGDVTLKIEAELFTH